MKVVIASKNPVKIEAAKNAFSNYFKNLEIEGIKVESGVSEMPKSESETIRGALNRVENIEGKCDFKVGLEGGMEKSDHGYFLFGWAAISDGKEVSLGSSPRFILPKEIGQKLYDCKDPDPVADEYFKIERVGKKQGAVGYFTKGQIDRSKFLELAITMALTRFLHKDKYKK